jgi:hypothetical protein
VPYYWQSEVFKSGQNMPGILKHVETIGADPAQVITDAGKRAASPIKVSEVLPRLKEGGAFVKFSHDPSITLQDAEDQVKAHLESKPIKPWWAPFSRMNVSLVRGKPWVEDLYRLPTLRLKVEFLPTNPGETPAELSQEQLYSFFRPYGKLTEIIPQESDSKIAPRYALLDFASRKKAIMARNCMHGYLVIEAQGGGKSGTILRLTYEQKIKAHWIRDWLVNHPRIVIPALAALIAGISIVVFDP